MTTSKQDLMNALLAMDTYHRGYAQGVVVDAAKIGSWVATRINSGQPPFILK